MALQAPRKGPFLMASLVVLVAGPGSVLVDLKVELAQEPEGGVVAWVVALVYLVHNLVLQERVVVQAVVFLALLVQGHSEVVVEQEEVVQLVVAVLLTRVAWAL